ncbi:LOW QUALITY PROTEIN: gamma-tubulin complex component 3 homolog [Amphiura filiformis]|uniref:LOW QUALITY PROTEIN: gamma-tubulin complex component 3 homolog n=1 Tax=Amphiura filiformis TaxID=82378 RepID=UPI003B210142
MATGGGAETVSDKDNPQKLLLQLVRHLLHKAPDEDVTVQYQYALRLISSNFTPTVEGDDFQVAQRIRKKLANQSRVEDAAKFSELYTKLKSKAELKNKWAILYVLMTLAEDKRPGRDKSMEKMRVFWQGLPRMATSTPYPSRPTSHENTTASSDESRTVHQTMQQTYHTQSSGIGSGLSSISGYSQSEHHPSATGYLTFPGRTPGAATHYGVTFADDNQTTGTRLARMLTTADSQQSQARSRYITPAANSRAFQDSEEGSEVSESQLVRDLVYVFQGIDGHIVKFNHTEDAFRIDPQVVVSKPMRDLTHKLGELGWLFKKVRRYIDNRSQDKAFGVIGQSFCAALQQELTEYYRLLAVLQAQQEHETDQAVIVEPSETLSLIRLKVWMYEPTQRMKYLAILVDGCKDKKGGALCSSVESYTMHGDPAVKSLMKHILKVVALPVRSMLDKWIYEGQLEDKYHEFFVASDPTVKEEKLWHEKYSLRKSMIPSFIKMDQANKILSIGKSINFLHHVCKNNEPIKGRSEDKEEEVTDRYRDTEMLLDQDLDGSFQQVIDAVYQDTSKRLLHVLHQNFSFLEHLKAMRRYLLLGQGDFIQHLLDLLESELAKPANSLYLHNLTGVLETAIRATNAQFDDVDILHRLDVRLLQISPGDTGWDVFSLDYHVDGPISTVFTPQCKLLYLRVFNFLWRTKRMDYVLNQVWRGQMANAKALKPIPELSPVLHQCHILAAQMIHFVQQMQYYINFEVMECSWDELCKKVTAAEDLDHIIAAHEVFLDTIIRRALLDQQSRPLLTQLRAIFDLIIQFQGTQETFFKSSLEELTLRASYEKQIAAKSEKGEWGLSQQKEEDERRRKVKFMREVIPTNRAQLKVLAKSYQDMVQKFLVSLTEHADDNLRLLAVRLDFNEVYKAKEPKLRSPMAFKKTKKVF